MRWWQASWTGCLDKLIKTFPFELTIIFVLNAKVLCWVKYVWCWFSLRSAQGLHPRFGRFDYFKAQQLESRNAEHVPRSHPEGSSESCWWVFWPRCVSRSRRCWGLEGWYLLNMLFFGGLILKKKLCILNSVHCLLELCHKPRRTSRTPNTRWFAQVWLMTTKRLWATTSSETRSDKIWMFTVFFLFFGSQKPSPRWMGIDTWPKQLELVQQFHHVVLKVFMFCCWFGFLWSSSNSDFFF